MMLITREGSGTAKQTSVALQPASPLCFLVPEEPSGAWILGRRAAQESALPPASSTARHARRPRVELLSLVGRRTPREPGHRSRPSGRIFSRTATEYYTGIIRQRSAEIPWQQSSRVTVFTLRRANVVCAESSNAPASVLVQGGVAGSTAPPRSGAAAAVSPRLAPLDTPRPVVSHWAATPGEQRAMEGWPVAISALVLGSAATGLAVHAAARARAGMPRMDLELGETDAASPSRARGSHGGYASLHRREESERHNSTAVYRVHLRSSTVLLQLTRPF